MRPLIVAEHLSKEFSLRHVRGGDLKQQVLATLQRRQTEVEAFWALRDVTVTIRKGEVVGLVGPNGSGKSTFLKLVAGIYRPTHGRLLVAADARIGTMMDLGVGFHPELTGRENLYLNASIHGLSRAEIDELYPAIVAYSGIERFMDAPLKTYSSGMGMRLGFAIAANLDPDILLLDELFAVGDETFQQQCIKTVTEFRNRGKTILFVSHSAESVRSICHRVLVLQRGQLVYDGPVERGLRFYRHSLRGPGARDERPEIAREVARMR